MLSRYVNGFAVKYLSTVEVDPRQSNQRELNGVKSMSNIFGSQRRNFPCSWLYFGDSEDDFLNSEGTLTWYDARENHPKRSEYRMYFSKNPVMDSASSDDLLVVARKPDDSILAIVAKRGSTFESQILWLFGLSNLRANFIAKELSGDSDREIGYAERIILEALGIQVIDDNESSLVEGFRRKFGELTFPSTRELSSYARELSGFDNSPCSNPDEVLMTWLNQEERLFKAVEKVLIEQRIGQGFLTVDDFLHYSLSVQNRRKSRAGQALELHLEQIFTLCEISYSRGAVTENRSKPDFIFPSIQFYQNLSIPDRNLFMLGVKSTCKDRWRQVLSEASRISTKHLLTLEPSISTNQTSEMQASGLQLVVPSPIHDTYTSAQQAWLFTLSSFMELVRTGVRS